MKPLPIRLIIFGTVPSLKNQKKLGKRGMYNDRQVVQYKANFGAQVPAPHKQKPIGSKEELLRLTVTLFHDSWKRDVDIAIIPDCLQECGVITNDRWIRQFHIYGERIDESNPRAEIVLEHL